MIKIHKLTDKIVVKGKYRYRQTQFTKRAMRTSTQITSVEHGWSGNRKMGKISVIAWRSVLLEEEAGVPGENRRPIAGH